MALYGFDHSVFKNIQSLAEIGFYFVQFRVDVIDAMDTFKNLSVKNRKIIMMSMANMMQAQGDDDVDDDNEMIMASMKQDAPIVVCYDIISLRTFKGMQLENMLTAHDKRT